MAAVVACAPRGSGFEQDCTRCHEPELRKQWGCDDDTAEPLAWISPCPFCEGNDEQCKHCTGSNRVPVHRCPNRLVEQRHLDAITATVLSEHGVLPDKGGWHDQAATYVQAFGLIWREVSYWRRVAQEKASKGKP